MVTYPTKLKLNATAFYLTLAASTVITCQVLIFIGAFWYCLEYNMPEFFSKIATVNIALSIIHLGLTRIACDRCNKHYETLVMFNRVKMLVTETRLTVEGLLPDSVEKEQKIEQTKFWDDNYAFKQGYYEFQLKRIAKTTKTVTIFDMSIIAIGTVQNGFGADLINYLKNNGW